MSSMTAALARYHARSPRYTLNTQDNSLVRFSGAERLSWEEKTELKNISLTGLSFTAPADLSPKIGEIIKIQFTVPDGEMMACYAVVTRIIEEDKYTNEVSVHFYKLDRLQRINLVQGLAEKINHAQLKPHKAIQNGKDQFIYMFLMFLSIVSWLVVIQLHWQKIRF